VSGHGKTVFQFAYDNSNFCVERGIASHRELLAGRRSQGRLKRAIEGQLFRTGARELIAEITKTSSVERIHAVMAMIRLRGSRLNRNRRSIGISIKLCERYEGNFLGRKKPPSREYTGKFGGAKRVLLALLPKGVQVRPVSTLLHRA